MQKGDIVLIPFPFTDLSGNKKRPALILISGDLDITVSFITTQLQWEESTDVLLHPNNANGLKKKSLLRTGKIATIDKTLAIGRLGTIESDKMKELDKKLIQLFRLSVST